MLARRLSVAVLAALLLSLSACGGGKPGAPTEDSKKVVEEDLGPDWFKDLTAASGVQHTYRNGEEANHLAILESLGGGVALIDYDGDGLLDVFLPGGGHFDKGFDEAARKDVKAYAEAVRKEPPGIHGYPGKLYRNQGGFQFKDVTAEVMPGQVVFYTHGAAVCDYDRDGWPDLLVTGWHRLPLYHNEPDGKGGRRLVPVPPQQSGLPDGLWTTSAGFADFDGDGWTDLYVCQYADWSWNNHPADCKYDGKTLDVCPPKEFSGLPHLVFRNNGTSPERKNRSQEGQPVFSDVSKVAGLRPGGKDASKGLGVLIVDVNDDGKPDVYVCNDTVENFLYLNLSQPGQIQFKEQGMASFVACDDRGMPNGSMGTDAGDFDHSGKPSLWVTNYEKELHALYRNECRDGHVYFNYWTQRAGIAALGQSYVAWGTGFIDFDLDGWEDLFVANGHAIRFPTGQGSKRKQNPVLLRNTGAKFQAVTPLLGSYGQGEHLARGVAFGDLDNDGRVDMVINHTNDPVAVLKNVAGEGRHWLGVQLVGKGNNACTVGSRVVLEADGQRQTRFSKGGCSYCSSNDPRMVFGLGKVNRIDKLTVHWPDGSTSEHRGLAVDCYHRIEQEAK